MNKIAKRMNKIAKDFEWDKDSLWKLRMQVPVGSLFYDDYKNDMGVDERYCISFFDGYMEFIEELAEEDFDEQNLTTEEKDEMWHSHWDEIFKKYDNKETLEEWYYCSYDEPLPVKDDEEEDY